MKTGLFIGRFQPFHNAHVEDVKLALQEVDHVVIGIGSANESRTKRNPFTVHERKEIITSALQEHSIDQFSFIEINDTQSDTDWVKSVEQQVPLIDVVYTGNDWTEQCFSNYHVHKIKLIPGISATIIRGAIRGEQEWKNLVPSSTAEFIEKNKEKIK